MGGALSFWDYATAAPYIDIDMNPEGYNSADAVSKPCWKDKQQCCSKKLLRGSVEFSARESQAVGGQRARYHTGANQPLVGF